MSDEEPKPFITKKVLLIGVILLIELTGHGIFGTIFRILTGWIWVPTWIENFVFQESYSFFSKWTKMRMISTRFLPRNPIQQQKKSSNPIDCEPECNIFSSMQVADYFNSILKSSEAKDKPLYLSLVNYFNLENEILPKKYSEDKLCSIIDASREAIKNGTSQKLISVYLNNSFALRTRARKKASR